MLYDTFLKLILYEQHSALISALGGLCFTLNFGFDMLKNGNIE
jgi:hypothetical protein